MCAAYLPDLCCMGARPLTALALQHGYQQLSDWHPWHVNDQVAGYETSWAVKPLLYSQYVTADQARTSFRLLNSPPSSIGGGGEGGAGVGFSVTGMVWGVGLQRDATVHPSHHGCLPSDFNNFPSGSIALFERGDTGSMVASGAACSFRAQAANAEAAGAVGALIFDGNMGERPDTLPDGIHTIGVAMQGVTIPVFATTLRVVNQLRVPLQRGEQVELRMGDSDNPDASSAGDSAMNNSFFSFITVKGAGHM